MDTYTTAAYESSKLVTKLFSTSFSASTRLLHKDIRADIYAIYGLVRVADEIVDTYKGSDAKRMLDSLEQEVYNALKSGFSSNITVHAFCQTVRHSNGTPRCYH